MESGDIEDLIGLTLLHTAYASRRASNDTLLLANGKQLTAQYCPYLDRSLFEEILNLKKLINHAFKMAGTNRIRGDEEREKAESKIACDWIGLIKQGKVLTLDDAPGSTPDQLGIVNEVISKIADLGKVGRHTLPDSPRTAVKRMPGGKF